MHEHSFFEVQLHNHDIVVQTILTILVYILQLLYEFLNIIHLLFFDNNEVFFLVKNTVYCIKTYNEDLNIAASDISKKFKNTSQEEKKYYKIEVDAARSYPFTGKSSITSLSFNFLDGAKMILACYIMDKQAEQKESFLTSISNKKDTFRIDIRSHKFNNFLKKNK